MTTQTLAQVMFAIAASLPACSRTHRTGDLIEHYRQADCIAVELTGRPDQPLRTWNHKITTADGVDVEVFGERMPGGRISVRFGPRGETDVAANAGDYIYPADVRIDSGHTHLYIRASGAPASSFSRTLQTWLFEYDLRQRRQTARLRVDETVLPPECAPGR